jgi:hypothetical protein
MFVARNGPWMLEKGLTNSFFMTLSVRDLACKYNHLSEEEESVCAWCSSMLNYQPREGWNVFLTNEDHERAIEHFGGPHLPSRQRWQHLLRSLEGSEHLTWAALEQGIDPIEVLPCSNDAFLDMAKGIAGGRRLTGAEEQWLQSGVRFHDGSTLRYLSESWFLDDVKLPSLSLEAVVPLLADVEGRRGWDLPALVLGLASCSPLDHDVFAPIPHPFQRRQGRVFRLRSHYRPLASMLVWLINRLQVDRPRQPLSREVIPMMAWAHDIKQRLFERQGDNLQAMFSNALSNHPPGLFERYDMPWMRAWQHLEDTVRYPRTLNWAVRTVGRSVMFRVRTLRGSTRLIKVPARADAWAALISLSHSPLNSPAGRLLLGLQHNWSVAYTEEAPAAPSLIRSLEFCHQIMNGLPNRVFVQHGTALVLGQLGHAYEVRVGAGQHGAPYQIHHLFGLNRHSRSSICIHSGNYSQRVPLGDTMGSVLLSMANDIKAATESIESLAEVVAGSPPFGFPIEHVPTAWLDALDQDALEMLRTNRYQRTGWFLPVVQRHDEAYEGNARFWAGMAGRRRRRLGQRTDEEWQERFQTGMEASNEFPFQAFVDAWRDTVRPHFPSNNEDTGLLFGPNMRHMMNRYHHLMPHRRADDVHAEGDVRDGERRWCEVFARVWELMSLAPINTEMLLPNMDGDALSFGHANLRVTMRNRLERNVVSRMARALGYARFADEGRYRTLVRKDHPRPDARLQLTDVLREAQDRQGVRGAPPRWWNYCDVGRAPDETPPLRWELEVDLTDNPRRRGEDDGGSVVINRWFNDRFVLDE